jgi:hypothetical protein
MILARKIYLLIVSGGLFLAVLLWGISILTLDWRAGHTSLYLINPKINWIGYYVDHAWEKVSHYFHLEQRIGLAPVRMYVPRRSQETLVSNLPDSSKKWQPGFLLYPNNKIGSVKVRHRGDNPYNWMFEKKSWRIKTKKNALIDGTRVINYTLPQVGQSSEHIGLSIARRAGILAPKSRLVELFVNDQSMGVYFETEHLNEEFLRNNGLMPVNLYKGEQYYQERAFRVDHDMFNDPSLWEKTSENNYFKQDDVSDLAQVFDLLRTAENSPDEMSRLKRIAPYTDWARYAALQTLIQSPHNDAVHNMRTIFDSWRGQFIPIAYDLGIEATLNSPIILDHAPHSLLRLYHRHSDFLLEKYRQLYRLLVDEDILLQAVQELTNLESKLAISMIRDENLAQGAFFWGYDKQKVSLEGARQGREVLSQRLKQLNLKLKAQITAQPDAKWQATESGVALNIGGVSPVSEVTLQLAPSSAIPTKIAWDKNRNGKLDAQDLILPASRTTTGITIDAVWLSNRTQKSSEHRRTYAFFMELSAHPVRFELIGDVPFKVRSMKAKNSLTSEQIYIPQGQASGSIPGRWNVPVLSHKVPMVEIWSGHINISGNKLLDAPVRILAGTTIDMAPGANIVFREHVEINGTSAAPVVVKRAKTDQPWGVFALQGEGTSGSRVSHLQLSGGSGALVDTISYTGMLSIHDTSNIILDKVIGIDNVKVDDLVHVVYSRDIVFRNCEFLNARSDALDIDISTVLIEGGRIVNAGNDAIDLMTSSVQILSIDLMGSGDKGISVGENSRALAWNVRLQKNVIGIEAKDASLISVINSDFTANTTHINAYKKNWRYGVGGQVEVKKSYFSGTDNQLSAKKKSLISISDSTINPMPENKKRVLFSADVDSTGKRRARSNILDDANYKLPARISRGHHKGVRGAIR